MTNKKSTKRALLMSALSLLLCVSMLVGTTFAWFTDEVKSGTNIIAAGNLDVELTHTNKAVTDEKVRENVKLFTDVKLWEPGAVAYEKLTVANVGDLALKYNLAINVANANSVKHEGELYTLANVLKVAVVDAEKLTSREAAIAAGAEKGWKPLTSWSENGKLYAKGDETGANADTYGIVIYWEPSVNDNIWNLNNGKTTTDGGKQLTIELGVHLTATQLVHENDSYGTDYDKDSSAFVSTADELRNAIATVKDGGTVYVNDGIYNINSQLNISGKSINIVGVGENVVIHSTIKNSGYNKIFYIYGSATESEDITVNISNVTLTSDIATKSDIWIRTDTQNGAKVSGDVNVNLDNVTCTSIICDNNYVDGDTVNLKINNSNVKKVTLDASPYNGNGLNTYTNLTHNASRIDSINIQSGVNDLTHIKINDVSPTAHGEQQTLKYISTAEELASLGGTKINGTYVLMADLNMFGYEMKPIQVMNNDALVFNGNGYEISNIMIVAANANGMTGAGNEVAGLFDVTANASSNLTVNNLTIKNASISCSGYAATIVGYANSSTDNITLNNVDVIGATISSDSVAALVGYTVGPLTMTDCDVSGLALTGEAGRPEKVGALVGTANQAACTVTVNNCTNATSYNDYGRVINGATWKGVIGVNSADSLQKTLDEATGDTTIALRADITGDVTVAQKENVKIVIDGQNHTYKGSITVDGKSATIATAGLTIQNVNFVAEDLTFDACVRLGARGNTNTRYTCNVTVENCTFVGDKSDKYVAIKSYTGGDKNLTVTGCIVTDMHSLLQIANAANLTVADCQITGQRGMSVGASTNVEISNTKIDAATYGIRAEGREDGGCMTITNCDIKANIPVVIRKVVKAYTLTVNGTNTITETNTEGLWCVAAYNEYGDVDKAGLDAVGADVTININDNALDKNGVFVKQ